jgi:hypothetical protein
MLRGRGRGVVDDHRPDRVRETALAHHVPRQVRCMLQITRRARANLVGSEHQRLGHLAAHTHVNRRAQLTQRSRVFVRGWDLPRQPKRAATWINGGLVKRVSTVREESNESMASLVIRRVPDAILRAIDWLGTS